MKKILFLMVLTQTIYSMQRHDLTDLLQQAREEWDPLIQEATDRVYVDHSKMIDNEYHYHPCILKLAGIWHYREHYSSQEALNFIKKQCIKLASKADLSPQFTTWCVDFFYNKAQARTSYPEGYEFRLIEKWQNQFPATHEFRDLSLRCSGISHVDKAVKQLTHILYGCQLSKNDPTSMYNPYQHDTQNQETVTAIKKNMTTFFKYIPLSPQSIHEITHDFTRVCKGKKAMHSSDKIQEEHEFQKTMHLIDYLYEDSLLNPHIKSLCCLYMDSLNALLATPKLEQWVAWDEGNNAKPLFIHYTWKIIICVSRLVYGTIDASPTNPFPGYRYCDKNLRKLEKLLKKDARCHTAQDAASIRMSFQTTLKKLRIDGVQDYERARGIKNFFKLLELR